MHHHDFSSLIIKADLQGILSEKETDERYDWEIPITINDRPGCINITKTASGLHDIQAIGYMKSSRENITPNGIVVHAQTTNIILANFFDQHIYTPTIEGITRLTNAIMASQWDNTHPSNIFWSAMEMCYNGQAFSPIDNFMHSPIGSIHTLSSLLDKYPFPFMYFDERMDNSDPIFSCHNANPSSWISQYMRHKAPNTPIVPRLRPQESNTSQHTYIQAMRLLANEGITP